MRAIQDMVATVNQKAHTNVSALGDGFDENGHFAGTFRAPLRKNSTPSFGTSLHREAVNAMKLAYITTPVIPLHSHVMWSSIVMM